MTRISLALSALALALVVTSTPLDANACSCLPPTVEQSYQTHSDVFTARVIWGVEVGLYKWYVARVRFTIKGCTEKGQWVYLKTANNGAACGAYLETGKTWLINGNEDETPFSVPVFSIHSCAANKLVGSVTSAERQWLLGRYNCCGEECGCVDGSQPVLCFGDPCALAGESACPGAECQTNLCGGCKAEYYDSYGYQLCQPCKKDSDCSWEQTCGTNGTCVSGCETDLDCAKDSWCSPTQDGGGQCKGFQQEGDWCGGFTPVWAQAKCAPGLVCTDYPLFLPDAPGTCRLPCEDNGECGEGQYCSKSGYCRDDGACMESADCELPGNDYPHIECVGYGVCGDEDLCSWECGEKPADMSLFTSCGNPVCSSDDTPPAGTPKCTFEQIQGASCDKEGFTCDAGLGCGAVLVCAEEDPKLEGCPKSQRAAKKDIKYLDGEAKQKVHQQVMDMKLATWRYKDQRDGTGDRLGFIIEDAPEHPAVAPNGKRVDLYAFASMAMATLQVQQEQIQALRAEVAELKGQLNGEGDVAPGMCVAAPEDLD